MKRRTPSRVSRTAPAPRRRGVAMLLVIVALGTGVVLAGAYMTSNSTAGSVGDNAASAVKASWSAKAASDIGVAILETDLDWRTAIADGTLISDQPIAGGNVTITFTNMIGGPPSADDSEVIMTVTAVVNGVESKKQKLVRLIPDADVNEAVDNLNDEFTVFTTEGLLVEENAIVGVWPASPDAWSSKPAKIGVGFDSGSEFQVHSNAKFIKAALFLPNTAGVSLDSSLSDTKFAIGEKLAVKPPAVAKIISSEFDALTPIASDVQYVGNPVTLPPAYYKKLKLEKGAVGTIDAQFGQYYAFEDINVTEDSALVIKGNVHIRIDDDLRVEKRSTIYLADANSSVRFLVYDNITIDNSVINLPPAVAANEARSRHDSFKYRDPSKFKIYGVFRTAADLSALDDAIDFTDGDFSSGGQDFQLKNGSLVIANFHAPYSKTKLDDASTLFGRITAKKLEVKKNSAILGDPRLDKGIGLTEKYGPLYKENGDPIDGLVEALNNYDESSGWDAVKASLSSALTSTTSIVDSLLGGGKTGGGTTATERKKGRAIAREWPMKAFAMEIQEKKTVVADEPDGSFLVAKADDDDDEIDD